MIQFQLVSLSGSKYSGEAYEVLLPTPDGIIAVFKNHMPLVSLASRGVISVRTKANEPDDMMAHFATNGGVIEVMGDTIRVLVNEADASDDIDTAATQKAIDEAKKLRAEAKDQVSLDHAQSLLDRSAVRLKVAELRRRRRK